MFGSGGVGAMIGLGEFDETIERLEGWLASVFCLMSRLCLGLAGVGVMIELGEFDETLGRLESWLASVF